MVVQRSLLFFLLPGDTSAVRMALLSSVQPFTAFLQGPCPSDKGQKEVKCAQHTRIVSLHTRAVSFIILVFIFLPTSLWSGWPSILPITQHISSSAAAPLRFAAAGQLPRFPLPSPMGLPCSSRNGSLKGAAERTSTSNMF